MSAFQKIYVFRNQTLCYFSNLCKSNCKHFRETESNFQSPNVECLEILKERTLRFCICHATFCQGLIVSWYKDVM